MWAFPRAQRWLGDSVSTEKGLSKAEPFVTTVTRYLEQLILLTNQKLHSICLTEIMLKLQQKHRVGVQRKEGSGCVLLSTAQALPQAGSVDAELPQTLKRESLKMRDGVDTEVLLAWRTGAAKKLHKETHKIQQ